MISEVRIETRSSSSRAQILAEQKEKKARREEEGKGELARGNDGGSRRLKKPRTHRGARREEEEAGLSKSRGLESASLRTFKEAFSPHESPLVPLNLVLAPIKHGTIVQSNLVPPKEVKQTPPFGPKLRASPTSQEKKVEVQQTSNPTS
ncbi:hypothetical protein DVH24_025171 [Malus domestica]|uniref:Uncharacterized protein n=1 Tax=Malus domestica TaxID=3750 RepID=A0A498HLS8_MALDO|nr:hypothetical protein DVH24_025171 [Malus domestica]